MPTTQTITLYKYSELSDDAKEHAREVMSDINLDSSGGDEYTCEFWQDEKLPALGFDSAKISYSGFWSQGDGASFKCNVNLVTWLKVNKLCNQYRALYSLLTNESESVYVDFRIDNSGHYCHDKMMRTDYPEIQTPDDEKFSKAIKQFDSLVKIVLKNAQATARQIYKELEAEYDYNVSKEAIEETIKIKMRIFSIYSFNVCTP